MRVVSNVFDILCGSYIFVVFMPYVILNIAWLTLLGSDHHLNEGHLSIETSDV